MATRNITLSIPEELVRRAKILAAERDTSLSALVSELLAQLSGSSTDFAQAWQEEEQLMRTGVGLRIGEIRWTRDDLHQR